MLVKYEGIALGQTGVPTNSLRVNVTDRISGAALTVYSDPAGKIVKTQPILSGEGGVTGRYFFYAKESMANLTISSGLGWSSTLYPLSTFGNVYNVRFFGAKGDGSTDDTTAIQNAMNAASFDGGTVYFPAGHYKFSNLIFGRNSSNTGWANNYRYFGKVRLIGEGQCRLGSVQDGYGTGSILEQLSPASGPAILIPAADTQNPAKNSDYFTFKRLTVIGNSPDWVIDAQSAAINANLEDLNVYQTYDGEGSGNGIRFRGVWIVNWSNVYVEYDRRLTESSRIGIGIKMINDVENSDGDMVGGGGLTFTNCGTGFFRYGWQFGDTDYDDSSEAGSAQISAISLIGCAIADHREDETEDPDLSGIGIDFGFNVRAATMISCHIEKSDCAVQIAREARNVKLDTCYIASNGIGTRIGISGNDNKKKEWRNVSIENCTYINQVNDGKAIEVNSNEYASNLLLVSNHIGTDKNTDDTVGIDLAGVHGKPGIQLLNNRFPPSGDYALDTPIDSEDSASNIVGFFASDISESAPVSQWQGQNIPLSATTAFHKLKAGEAQPEVYKGTRFKTDNQASQVTITNFDNAEEGNRIFILAADGGNTTFDFSNSNLKGNGGVDWTPSDGDFMECTFDGTN